MAQEAIKEEGPTGDIVTVLRKVEDFYSETGSSSSMRCIKQPSKWQFKRMVAFYLTP